MFEDADALGDGRIDRYLDDLLAFLVFQFGGFGSGGGRFVVALGSLVGWCFVSAGAMGERIFGQG